MPRGTGCLNLLVWNLKRCGAILFAWQLLRRIDLLAEKTITLEMVAARTNGFGFKTGGLPRVLRCLDRIFEPLGIKPRVVVECDSSSSLITEIETGRGVAIASPILRHASGKRLIYRPLTGTTEVMSVGIARATKG